MMACNLMRVTPALEIVTVTNRKHKVVHASMQAIKHFTGTIVKFTQLCSKFPPIALLNFACDWLALDKDISFGRLTSPNV